MPIVISYDGIYTDPKFKYTTVNPTGYRYNINHPVISKLYTVYRKKHGIPEHFAPSDKQRLEFEGILNQLIASGRIVVRHLSR